MLVNTPKVVPRDDDEHMRAPCATPDLLTKAVISGGAPRPRPETKSRKTFVEEPDCVPSRCHPFGSRRSYPATAKGN